MKLIRIGIFATVAFAVLSHGGVEPSLKKLDPSDLVEDDGERPQRWLRTHRGDVALEHEP